MQADELEMIALKAGCKVPRVTTRICLSGSSDKSAHLLQFVCAKGNKTVEVALDATPQAAQAAIQAAVVG